MMGAPTTPGWWVCLVSKTSSAHPLLICAPRSAWGALRRCCCGGLWRSGFGAVSATDVIDLAVGPVHPGCDVVMSMAPANLRVTGALRGPLILSGGAWCPVDNDLSTEKRPGFHRGAPESNDRPIDFSILSGQL